MKSTLLAFLILNSLAFANCNVEPLRKEIIKEYSTSVDVTNEKGESGKARGQDFVISDYLMNINNEIFLIANFKLNISWPDGKNQLVKTIVVATIDESTCRVKALEPTNQKRFR